MKVYSFDNLFFTNAKTKDEVVYKILDTMVKNKHDLIAVQPVLSDFTPAFAYKQYDVAYHPGALKYFQEHKHRAARRWTSAPHAPTQIARRRRKPDQGGTVMSATTTSDCGRHRRSRARVRGRGRAAQTFGFASMQPGTINHTTSSAIAKVLKEKGGLNTLVQPTAGESVMIAIVGRGEAEFGMANAPEIGTALANNGQPNLRMIGAALRAARPASGCARTPTCRPSPTSRASASPWAIPPCARSTRCRAPCWRLAA